MGNRGDKEVALMAIINRIEITRRLGNYKLHEHATILRDYLELGKITPDEALQELEEVYS